MKRARNSPYSITTEAGMKNVAIYEVEDAKLYDGIKEALARHSQYLAILGYGVQVEVVATVAEAIALLQPATK